MLRASFAQTCVLFSQTAFVVAALFVMPTTAHAQVIYKHDFKRPDRIREYWSHHHRGSPEKGTRIFLGPFADENVALTLKKLPKHKYLKIEFDLLILVGWAGSRTDGYAPDLWQLAVTDGPMLLNTSFSLWPKFAVHPQAYPDIHPAGVCKANTGAVEKNTLGFIYDQKYGVRDAVYRLRQVFPHNQESVQFNFAAVGRTGRRYRGVDRLGQWGLDNVRVEALAQHQIKKLTPNELEQVWKDLAAKDALKGRQATDLLRNAGDQAFSFLQNKIGKKATAAEIDQLIEQLDNKRFAIRAKAEQRLVYQASRWLDKIEQARAKPKSLEQRQRLDRVLATVNGTGGDRSFSRRWARVEYVLQFAARK